MATPPTHHLSTARDPLYGNSAHGAPLDHLRAERLLAGGTGVGWLGWLETPRTEGEATGRAAGGGRRGGPGRERGELTDRLTVRARAPGQPGVQPHLSLQPGGPESLSQMGRHQLLHLGEGELRLLPGTGRVGAGDAGAAGQDLQADVLGQTVRAELTVALGERHHLLPGPVQQADGALHLLHLRLLVNPEGDLGGVAGGQAGVVH